MNEERIPKKILKMKVKENCPRGRQIKMGTTGLERYHTEGRKNMG
jgi:hypothetical protein